MPRILVTGATGFIGRYVISALAARHKVVAMVRRVPVSCLPAGVNVVVGDLAQPLDYGVLPETVDAVVHLAQSQHYREFPEHAKDIFDINIRGTLELLEYARQAGVTSFIFASSGGVYGLSHEEFIETHPVNPIDFYHDSKCIAERLISDYRHFFRTIIMRLFFVYGHGQHGRLIPNLLHKVQTGSTVVIQGDPGLRINPVHVSDTVRVFEAALEFQNSGVFNVAGDEVVTITDLVRLMEKVSGLKADVQYADAELEGDLIGENTRMKEVLGVLPKMTLLQGLEGMQSRARE